MHKALSKMTATVMLIALVYILTNSLHAQSNETNLRVMSYNIHRGGVVHLKQPLSQTAKVIKLAKADIVGIQEPRSPQGFTTKQLAELLGWNHSANARKGIILTVSVKCRAPSLS